MLRERYLSGFSLSQRLRALPMATLCQGEDDLVIEVPFLVIILRPLETRNSRIGGVQGASPRGTA